mgnify:CR=1 FL=1
MPKRKWLQGFLNGDMVPAFAECVCWVYNVCPKIWSKRKLGKKLLNPQVESLLLDPEIMAVVNHDPDNSESDFLVLDHFFVNFPSREAIELV